MAEKVTSEKVAKVGVIEESRRPVSVKESEEVFQASGRLEPVRARWGWVLGEEILQLQAKIGNRATGRLLIGSTGRRQQINGLPNSAIGRRLPERLEKRLKRLSGLAMGDVRVHYNTAEPEQFQAAAFTSGRHIFLAPGQEQHLSHEAWHVVQQKQRRVRPTRYENGTAFNDDPALEREATEMGRRAAAGGELIFRRPSGFFQPGPALNGQVIQRQIKIIEGDETLTADDAFERLKADYKGQENVLRYMLGVLHSAHKSFQSDLEFKFFMNDAIGKGNVFNFNGEMVSINGQISFHLAKFNEYILDGKLPKVLAASRKPAGAEAQELVSTKGGRLRFEEQLTTMVNQFLTTNLDDLAKRAKVQSFLKGDTERNDRLRLFDLVNDSVAADVKKKACDYAADYAVSARTFANHYTYYISTTPKGDMPHSEVRKRYEAQAAAAKSGFGVMKGDKAETPQAAIDALKKAAGSGQLNFETPESAVSHMRKHPMQAQDKDDINRYIEWARLTILKGDPDASRNQFDSGWSVDFMYGGHYAIGKVTAEGLLYISSFEPQQTSFSPTTESKFFGPGAPLQPPVALMNLKNQIDNLWSALKIVNNDTRPGKKTDPDPNQGKLQPGARFFIEHMSNKYYIRLEQGAMPDEIIQPDKTEFRIRLDNRVGEGLTERSRAMGNVVIAWIQQGVDPRSPQGRDIYFGELAAMTAEWLPKSTEDPGSVEAFQSQAGRLMSLMPGDNYETFRQFVFYTMTMLTGKIEDLNQQLKGVKKENDPDVLALDNEILLLSAVIETKRAELQNLTPGKGVKPDQATVAKMGVVKGDLKVKQEEAEQLQAKREKVTGAPLERERKLFVEKAERLVNLFTMLQTRVLLSDFAAKGGNRIPGVAISGELVRHLVTAERKGLSSFRASGIGGGHDEMALRFFLDLHPEYHFVEMKRVNELGTTLRLYRQFMWKHEDQRPPALADLASRPNDKDQKAADWEEAGVKKGTAENLLVWLLQGEEAVAHWKEFDKEGPSSQRIGRALYEGAPGEKSLSGSGVEFGGRLEMGKDLRTFFVTQLAPHVDWLLQFGK